MTATCLDVYLSCLVHRNEPRFCYPQQPTLSSVAGPVSANQNSQLQTDLDLCLTSFAIFFPAQTPSTWFYMDEAGAQPKLCSSFLHQLFEHLVPLLERLSLDKESSTTLILAGVVLQAFSWQLPSAVLCNEAVEINRTLQSLADIQRESSLSRSKLWQAMFDSTTCPHPFLELQQRLRTLASASLSTPVVK